MNVINLLGGANTGKTTTALGLTYFMKRAGLRVELAPEYAKVMSYEERDTILADQLYMLAKQNRTQLRLSKMDWVVTDSSLLLGLVYQKNEPAEFGALVKAYYERYNNINFYFPRDRSFRFETVGRVQASHDEAAEFDDIVRQYLPADTIYLEQGVDYISQIVRHLNLGISLAGPVIRLRDL